MPNPLILRVAVFAPIFGTFDYLMPPSHGGQEAPPPGIRVRVSFGHHKRTGLVLACANHSDVPATRLKPVESILDQQPLLTTEDLKFLDWTAAYYQHPLGEVIALALPVRLRQGKAQLKAPTAGWQLTEQGQAVTEQQLLRAPRQAALMQVLHAAHPRGVARTALNPLGESLTATLSSLRKKGWIEPWQPESNNFPATTTGEYHPFKLNPAQQAAVDAVNESFNRYQAFLLDGITGSGKTEVYLELTARILQRGRQVLIVVPEIGLTPQLLRRFRRRFKVPIALLHSGLADGEREIAWRDAAAGRIRLIIGTRSAVFTPLPGLGLIIVDEEHDLSLKQQDSLRYSARDLAVQRAHRCHCPILLGSATPSLESLRNVQNNRYQRLLLPERAGNAVSPSLDILDIRSAPLTAGLSPTLIRFMREELAQGNQVLLFLNRRGYAPVLCCSDCGWVAGCNHCDARMTLHQAEQRLWCHHCGHQHRLPPQCPDCDGSRLYPLGQGTERVESALQHLFPDYPLARIDRDTTRRKGRLAEVLDEARSGKYSLLLGTQMLAKGHHLPKVTLVALLDIDQGLFSADYRATERLAQLVVQVAGRAGRADRPGRVLIQTRYPDHPLLQTLIKEGYSAFAQAMLAERRQAQLPPFSFQALIRAEAPQARPPLDFLSESLVSAESLGAAHIELLGPVPSPMERRAGHYRAQLLIQSSHRGHLQKFLWNWLPELHKLKSGRRVRWSIDVDPQELF